MRQRFDQLAFVGNPHQPRLAPAATVPHERQRHVVKAAAHAEAETRRIRIEHIQPGKPQQNAYVERYNRTVRYDWLAQYLFDSIEEVQESAANSSRNRRRNVVSVS